MYEATWWGWLVMVWEVLVYNSVMDLQQCWQVSILLPTPQPACHDVLLLHKISLQLTSLQYFHKIR